MVGGPPKLGTSIIAEPGIADAETAAGDTATTGGGVVSVGMLRTGVAGAGGGGGGFPGGGGGGGGGGGAAGSERAVGAADGSAVTSGTGTIGDPAAPSRAPQLPQKVAPTRVGAPHEVQFTLGAQLGPQVPDDGPILFGVKLTCERRPRGDRRMSIRVSSALLYHFARQVPVNRLDDGDVSS